MQRTIQTTAKRALRSLVVLPRPQCGLHSSTAAALSSPRSSPPSPSSFLAPLTPARPRLVLGVETSCDDTSLAVLSTDGRVLAHDSMSQWGLFEQFAGVQPLAASQAHAANIDGIFHRVMQKAKLQSAEQLDGIAVTAGPGMAPCLKVGLQWASSLARSHSLPFIGVHHMQAHAFVAQLDHPQLRFPFLALLISGGHTELWLVESLSKLTILSATVDDAVGEAFDKAARVIGIQRGENESPGAAVERLAKLPGASPRAHEFPYLDGNNLEFSFAGLKSSLQRKVFGLQLELANQQQAAKETTAAASTSSPTSSSSSSSPAIPPKLQNRDIQRMVKEFKQGLFKSDSAAAASSSLPSLPLSVQADLCASFQYSLLHQLSSRTELAVRFCRSRFPHLPISQLVVAGGVACNSAVRAALTHTVSPYRMEVLAPRPLHCMDNGIMIAWLGQALLSRGHLDTYDLCFVTRWPIGDKISMARISEEEFGGKNKAKKKAEKISAIFQKTK